MGNILGKIKEAIGLDEDVEVNDNMEGTESSNSINRTKSGKVVNINSAASTKILLSKPKTYEDAKEISEAIKEKKIVIVNTIALDAKVAQRLVDFISGACFVLDATVQEVQSRIYLLSPNTTEIQSDGKDELESKTFFNWVEANNE